MSLTVTQARRLGTLIAGARMRQGLSQAALAQALGVAVGWVSGLESGRFLDPSNERLANIAEILEIELAQIERIAGPRVRASLPGMRVYFRAKYDLTPEEADRVERYVQRLKKERP